MNCKYCGKVIKNCYNSQKYHPKCFKQRHKEYQRKYHQNPEVKQKAKEYRQKPEVKQRMSVYRRKIYALKKELKKKILLKILEKYKK